VTPAPSPAEPTTPAVDVTRTGDGGLTIQVRHPKSGVPIVVALPPGAVGTDETTLTGLEMNVTTLREFVLDVRASRGPPAGTPALDGSVPVSVLGYASVDHGVQETQVGEVSFTFEVPTARLEALGVDPADVALYRYTEEGWTRLSTSVVAETDTHSVFRARSPGLSVFAVGATLPSQVEVTDVTLSARELGAGERLTVSAVVSNSGSSTGETTVTLRLDGEPVAERTVSVEAGASRTVRFERRVTEPGTVSVAVNDRGAGTVTVTGSTPPATTEPAPGPSSGSGPGMGITAVLLAAALLALLARRRRR
jgi:MYXO-CTERM domain-containing protein